MHADAIEAALRRGLTIRFGPAALSGWTLLPPPVPAYGQGPAGRDGPDPMGDLRHRGWACPTGGGNPGFAILGLGRWDPPVVVHTAENAAAAGAAFERARAVRRPDEEIRMLSWGAGCTGLWLASPGGFRIVPWLTRGRVTVPTPFDGLPPGWASPT